MLEAEFHLSIQEIDEEMDIPLFEAHMRYRDFSPPIGASFKAFIQALSGGNSAGLSYSSAKKPDSNLAELVADFGGFGGVVVSK